MDRGGGNRRGAQPQRCHRRRPRVGRRSPSNGALRHSAAAATVAVNLKLGTYEWYNDGGAFGTITVAKHNLFTSTVGSPTDSGTRVQSSNLAGFYITGGGDASGDCVFAGKVNTTGTGVSSAIKPGNWVCPSDHTSGTFYIGPVPAGPSATQAHGGSFARSGALPATAGPVVPGTYVWTVNGADAGSITFAAGETYTSTLDTNDSGAWVQGGKAVAVTVNGGSDSGEGCLFVGKANAAGTAIGTTSAPGSWVCPIYPSRGAFVIG